jgi:hypothetical protein
VVNGEWGVVTKKMRVLHVLLRHTLQGDSYYYYTYIHVCMYMYVVPVPCRTVHSNSKKMIFLPLPWYSVKNYFIELLFFHLA